jgi:hypothetical protein
VAGWVGPQQGAALVFIFWFAGIVAIGVIAGWAINGVVIGRPGDFARWPARRVDFPQAELHRLVSSRGTLIAARPGFLVQIMRTPSKAM